MIINVWLIDTVVVLLILTNLWVLGSSRLLSCIRIVAFQGVLMGLLPLVISTDLAWHLFAQAIISTVLKGFLFPWLLIRAVREANIRREIEPFVGFTISLLSGIGIFGLSLMLSHRIPLQAGMGSSLLTPLAIMTILVGLFMIISRKTAINQVLGYLVMENGIYGFGMAVVQEHPLIIEIGILLDVFMAVFVMGLTIFRINREFDHIDTNRLTILKDQ
ncbi:MAG: NADH-quinone oxidoreductase subunit K [Pseudomonadota bacterium]